MTNYERLIKEHGDFVKEVLASGGDITVAIRKDGTPISCSELGCAKCILCTENGCSSAKAMEWLNAEYNPYCIPLDTPIDTKVWVSDDELEWRAAHFAGFSKGKYCTWSGGKTSFSTGEKLVPTLHMTTWTYCKLAEVKK